MSSWRRVCGLLALCLASALVPGASPAEAADVTIDDAVEIAVAHVRDGAAGLGLQPTDVEHLRAVDAYVSRHNGVRHVYLRQLHRDLDVLEGELTAGITRDGRVFHTGSRLVAGIARSASGRPLIDASTAALLAAAQLSVPVMGPVVALSQSTGPDRETVLAAGSVSPSPVTARLAWQPAGPNSIRLAWNMEIDEASRRHWWNVSVDAENGAVLAAYDYVDYEHAPDDAHSQPAAPSKTAVTATADGASYRVFPSPLESPNDGPRQLVANPADPAASPYGWHDLDGLPGADSTLTRGNNVFAYADWTATNEGVIDAGSHPVNPLLAADGGDDLVFDFPLDLSQYPHLYREASVTNLFYWNNVIHDTLYGYGFDEAAGNFQRVNYTGEGAGNDAVEADGQDHSFINNATFSTPPDGSPGRMQMFLWQLGRQLLDGSLDAGIIAHEYGHGLSNRLTGGPSTTRCLRNNEQGGEGWSDFLGLALTALPTDTGPGRRGVGTYVLGESSRYGFGIRPQPYSTSFWNTSRYDSIKTQAIPHGVGWVWASMLWEMYWALIDVHGFSPDPSASWTAGGNTLALQLVIDGMKLQPCSPGFVDARDAIIAADSVLTGGANRCPIWAAFSKRGLGVSAVQGSSASVTDGTQAFDKPADC